jgi:hypothetical protein
MKDAIGHGDQRPRWLLRTGSGGGGYAKMLADCEVSYILVFLARAKMAKLLTLKEASDARGDQMEFPI